MCLKFTASWNDFWEFKNKAVFLCVMKWPYTFIISHYTVQMEKVKATFESIKIKSIAKHSLLDIAIFSLMNCSDALLPSLCSLPFAILSSLCSQVCWQHCDNKCSVFMLLARVSLTPIRTAGGDRNLYKEIALLCHYSHNTVDLVYWVIHYIWNKLMYIFIIEIKITCICYFE